MGNEFSWRWARLNQCDESGYGCSNHVFFLPSSGQSSSAATECTRQLLGAWSQMGGPLVFQGYDGQGRWRPQRLKAPAHKVLASAGEMAVRDRTKAWLNRIVALVPRGPDLQLLRGARSASSALPANCGGEPICAKSNQQQQLTSRKLDRSCLKPTKGED